MEGRPKTTERPSSHCDSVRLSCVPTCNVCQYSSCCYADFRGLQHLYYIHPYVMPAFGLVLTIAIAIIVSIFTGT